MIIVLSLKNHSRTGFFHTLLITNTSRFSRLCLYLSHFNQTSKYMMWWLIVMYECRWHMCGEKLKKLVSMIKSAYQWPFISPVCLNLWAGWHCCHRGVFEQKAWECGCEKGTQGLKSSDYLPFKMRGAYQIKKEENSLSERVVLVRRNTAHSNKWFTL